MTTSETPGLKDVLARARAASGEIAAALDEDQEPAPEVPVGWQPIWKRPRTPKSKAASKKELTISGRGSGTLPSAALLRGSRAGPAPGRAGSATRPRAAMPAPCPGCGTPTPGCGDDAGPGPLKRTRK